MLVQHSQKMLQTGIERFGALNRLLRPNYEKDKILVPGLWTRTFYTVMLGQQNSGFSSNSSRRIWLLFDNFFCDHCGKRYRRQKRDLAGGRQFGPQGWVHENVIGQILYYKSQRDLGSSNPSKNPYIEIFGLRRSEIHWIVILRDKNGFWTAIWPCPFWAGYSRRVLVE